MTFSDWHEEPIGRHHDREAFDCGSPSLNDYLRHHARRNHERRASKTILALSNDHEGVLLGYYTVSPASLAFSHAPAVIRRGLGRYEIAGFRLARLAVALSVQGRGLGGQLLLSAARRCILASAEVGGMILVIDAKDERAAQWYRSYGAISLEDTPLGLVLPLATLALVLQSEGKL